jgi:hypothetical protein
VAGPHLHVRRRANANGAWAKSRRSRAVPVDDLVVLAYDTYVFERDRCRQARDCDFVLVNLFRPPLGTPMRPGAVNELLTGLSRRAGLSRSVHPHQLRHGFASNVLDAGGALDEAQELLGHAHVGSTQVYLHPCEQRLGWTTTQIADDLHIGECTVKSRLHFALRALRLTLQRHPTRCALDAPVPQRIRERGAGDCPQWRPRRLPCRRCRHRRI